VLLGRLHGDAGQVAVDLVAELVDQADRLQVLAQGEAPGGQQAVGSTSSRWPTPAWSWWRSVRPAR
jgi:hypothetical protein